MAIRKGKTISGSIDRLVYRRWRKIDVVQSAPGKGGVKQTEATKKAASLFGRASKMSAEIRAMLDFFIINLYDGSNHNRMTKLVKSILEKCQDKTTSTFNFVEDSFERLNGLEFNANSPLTSSMKVIPECTYKNGTLTVNFPELINNQEFIFPKDTTTCVITIGTESYYLEDNIRSIAYKLNRFEVDNQQTIIEPQTFTFAVPDGCLCLAGITLHYYKEDRYGKTRINNKMFNPAAICGAIVTPGNFEKDPDIKWTKATGK